MESIIKLVDISKTYKNSVVLDNLNLTVQKKDIYGFIGQNGAGKTTTMRIIMSMVKQTAGNLELFGSSDNLNLRMSKGRIGTIIENPSFYPYLSAYENLKYFVKFKGISDSAIIDETLAMVGLKNVGKKKFKNFSLGMKQRLGLGLALLDRPDVLILDEPLNGLDPMGIVEFREILISLNTKYGITIVVSSHNLEELSHIATCYGFIHKGKILQEITREELEKKCRKYIKLEVDNIKMTATILEEKLGTRNYEVIDNKTIYLYDYVDEVEKVTASLVKAGIGIRNIGNTNISLEQYFLSLIKEDGKYD